MSKLILDATKSTPEVIIDPENKIFRVKGISTPINAFEFYQNIVDWMNEHGTEFPDQAVFHFNMPYFNSATMKAVLILLERIKKGMDEGKNWSIDWFVEDEDEFMLDAAESFQSILDIEFKISS